ncbi:MULTISPECIES: hypothetical protein [unclassified Pseudoalteromonas]|uniref:hypothetical protein n=1 Tax=unclassified Pseudoalteromonas TaxID=194690 RepID=UPI002359706F|nr:MULTISPECIES: hypothetical protein [unclassified Pseudoalteromonas]MDC9565853.1 hypothetical protein [Pseudoalteromonas sp. GAB2316C]MDC9570186.1 hypothetical protein [Pseudoalteromonas sp. GABNB9D]MDC9574376.1 hypothetical protein [Pseudoalteromonas sp. GABNS16A]MDC9578703.1 hypothetical protein [Pseudoalteromonas sp. GABNS16E]MDC9586267.1 hypothetical protein [Pseudoalteromonas sp. GABNS16C]
MAKVKVKYAVILEQVIDWPDDEMSDFSYENLQVNLEPSDASVIDNNYDILNVEVNNKPHQF